MRAEGLEWHECLHKVLYGYRSRKRIDGISPFEIMFGVTPRFPDRRIVNPLRISTMDTSRLFELVIAYADCAHRMLHRSLSDEETHFKVRDMDLLRREMARTGPKIDIRYCCGPYAIVSASHPHYQLENPSRRRSRKQIHARRLRLYNQRQTVDEDT